jgi:hypothetical protein
MKMKERSKGIHVKINIDRGGRMKMRNMEKNKRGKD